MSTTPAQAQANVSQPKRLPSFKSCWAREIGRSNLHSTTRAVLHALGNGFMDQYGGNAHPTIPQIAKEAGLSARRTQDHLIRAAEAGWLERWRFGKNNHNRRWQYQATFPPDLRASTENVHVVREIRTLRPVENGEIRTLRPLHKPCNRDLYKPRERGAENLEAASAASLSDSKKPQMTSLTKEWEVPSTWIEQATLWRPDLGAEDISEAARKFPPHHRSRRTVSADWNAEWEKWILRELPSKAGKPAHSGLTEQRKQENEARMTAAEAHSKRRYLEDIAKQGIDPNTGVKPTSVPAPPVATRMTGIRSEPRPEPDAQDKLRSERRATLAEQYRRDHGRPLPENCVV